MHGFNITKLILALAVIYLVIGLFSVIQNRGLKIGVSRRIFPSYCSNLGVNSLDARFAECAETSDLKYGYYWNFIQWKYFSNLRGIDTAIYTPLDLTGALVVVGISGVVLKRNRAKK
ncbi:MAG TPA: hypothetical protein VLE51_04005 [Candidatus Saccharimonadales bacterium]|nr:hypothetical protein [Candidatus Saccharimonadales bacterium]HSX27479.1 hypothetical protein [Patescibacteria group bacterium]